MTSRRDRRDHLTLDEIIDAALRVTERDGRGALTVRAIATEVGKSPMSLYYHVPSMSHLLDEIVERLIQEVVDPLAEPGSLADRLQATAQSYRALGRRYPESFPWLTMRRFNTPKAFGFLEHHLELFARHGYTPVEAARAFRIIGFFLNGAVLAEIGVRETGASASRSALSTGTGLESFPRIRDAAGALGPAGLDSAFDEGFQAVLTRALESKGGVPGR